MSVVYVVPSESDLDTWAPSTSFWRMIESVFPGSIIIADDGMPLPGEYNLIYDSMCTPRKEPGACVVFHQAIHEYATVVPGVNYERRIDNQYGWLKSGNIKIASCHSVCDMLWTFFGEKCDKTILSTTFASPCKRNLKGPVAGWFGTHARGGSLFRDLIGNGVTFKDVGPEAGDAKRFDGCSVYLGLSICGGFDPVAMDAIASGLPVAATSVGQLHRDLGFDCSAETGVKGSQTRFGCVFPPRDRVNTDMIFECVKRARKIDLPASTLGSVYPIESWKKQWIEAMEAASERKTQQKP